MPADADWTPAADRNVSRSRSLNAICASVEVLRLGDSNFECQQSIRRESRIAADLLQERGDEQFRRYEQHEAECDLADDQRGLQALASRGNRSRALFELAGRVGAARLQGRNQAEQHARRHRQRNREREHPPVDGCLGQPGNTITSQR